MAKKSEGQIPDELLRVASELVRHVQASVDNLNDIEWVGEQPESIDGPLEAALREAHRINRASNDLRALLTAYAHQFHEPRPSVARLARAQGALPQGVGRRYSPRMTEAVLELLRSRPDPDVVLAGIPSLGPLDITWLSDGDRAPTGSAQATKHKTER